MRTRLPGARSRCRASCGARDGAGSSDRGRVSVSRASILSSSQTTAAVRRFASAQARSAARSAPALGAAIRLGEPVGGHRWMMKGHGFFKRHADFVRSHGLAAVVKRAPQGENFWMGIGVMVAAVVLAIVVMLVFAEPISRFVEKHPSVKMLALSFLILIGVMLLAEGIGTHFNKGYIYFAMAFALLVEMLNLRVTHHSQKRAAS